jgi:hypothetical protein
MPTSKRPSWKIVAAAAIALALGAMPLPAIAHETDQFTVPPTREFADLGDYLTGFAFQSVSRGVDKTNARIREAVNRKAFEKEIAELQSPDVIAGAVNKEFPVALFLIDSLDKMSQTAEAHHKYPGRVVGYKKASVRKYVDLSINPFKAWECGTIKAWGMWIGTDKVGHFTDMGNHYWRARCGAGRTTRSRRSAACSATGPPARIRTRIWSRTSWGSASTRTSRSP